MPLALTPLDPTTLSSDAQRALSSGPSRMMAARGLAPIASPVDLVSVLYQLTLDKDQDLRKTANSSVGQLPERVLQAALADPKLDPRVLDFFARKVTRKPELVEALVLNQATADETIVTLAQNAPSKVIDLVATNEQRLLRCPEIIGAMYMNKDARMSTVDRAVELAVRNRIKVPGIAAWDEICEAILEGGKSGSGAIVEVGDDEEFKRMLEYGEARDEGDEREGDHEKDWTRMKVPMKVRMATIGGAFWRSRAISDTKLIVARAAVKSPSVKEPEVLKWASNHSLPGEIVKEIARRRDWVQNYAIKVALVNNPKTPVADSMKLVPHLREREVKLLARSRSVPSAVVAQARKLQMQRSGGRGGRR